MASLAFRAWLSLAVLAAIMGVVIGDVLFAIGSGFIGRVYREITYTSATIEVTASQRVIDTGPYAVVRHPMYASALLYLIGTPLSSGFIFGFPRGGFHGAFLVWRLLGEERLLAQELSGYTTYQARVRYRLIPGLW